MDALIYTVTSAADRALKSMQIRANNIANANTDGFLTSSDVATSQKVPGYGYDARVQSVNVASALDLSLGAVEKTGNPLDVMVKDGGFLAIAADAGGEAYIRAGRITIDRRGQLQVNSRPLLGEQGPIVLPEGYTQVVVAQDGTLSVQMPGDTALQGVDKLKLVKPEPQALVKNEQGLLVARQGGRLPVADDLEVQSGYVMHSNTSAVDEMVATTMLNNHFGALMKIYNTADAVSEAGRRLITE